MDYNALAAVNGSTWTKLRQWLTHYRNFSRPEPVPGAVCNGIRGRPRACRKAAVHFAQG